MQSHFLAMSLFSLLVSVVFAVLMREETREQLRLGATLCAGFLGSAVILGWLLYSFPL